jgi:hypothetical protein
MQSGQDTSNTYSGIYLNDATEVSIIANRSGDTGAGTRQKYGIAEAGTANNNRIIGNMVLRNQTGGILVSGAGTVVKDNYGYATENSGTATFSGDGIATSFSFAHGLAATPTVVNLEAKSADAVGDKYWSADATNITVTFAAAPAAGTDNVVIGWDAKVR